MRTFWFGLTVIDCGALANFGASFLPPFASDGVDTAGLAIDVLSQSHSNITLLTSNNNLQALNTRELQCRTPGYILCADLAGCCPPGDTCVPGGCCSAGEQKCGAKGCYNPSTSNCCSDRSTFCPKGYDCVTGRCCPTGEQPCPNSGKCYNPATQTCCRNSEKAWGCPKSATCCSFGFCYDAATAQCCPKGVCKTGTTCCEKECCPPTATCAANGLCTPKCTPAPTPSINNPPTQSTTQTINFVYDGARLINAAVGTSIPAPPRAVLENMCKGIEKMKCSPDNEIELTAAPKSQQSENRKKMCPKKWCAKGVNEYIKSIYPASLYPTGIPELAKEALTMAADMSCDEFPFARSHEGGDLQFGTRICIPANENSWQGGTMSGFFKKWLDKKKTKANPNYIAPNEKFVVKIVGWNCKGNAPIKRDAMSVNVNITGDEVYRSFDPSNPNLKMVTMPLGDLAAGTYAVSLSIGKGNFTSVSVVDYSGETYDSTTLADGSISFTLTEDTEAVSIIGITTDSDIKVQYHAQTTIGATTTQSSTASSAVPTSTAAAKASSKSSANGKLDSGWWMVRIMVIGLVGFATCLICLF